MIIQILLLIAITVQIIAMVYALKLVRATKYNSIWILFIIGFAGLSIERVIQMLIFAGQPVPRLFMADIGVVVSICLSIGVMYTHKLFKYIDRLNYQRQLWNRRMLTATLRAEERARSNFSKELHDGLGPLLSSAKMSLSVLQRNLHNEAEAELLANTTYVIDEAIRSIREISNNLSPHVLQDFGLARGVQHFIDRTAAMHEPRIAFRTNLRDERFEKDVEVILYRVICELINNSLKHAACQHIDLDLRLEGPCLKLDYKDDGRGFNPLTTIDCGMGLSNISSRVGSLGGESEIRSAVGRGMSASVTIRLQQEIAAPRRKTKHRNRKNQK